MLKTRSVVFVFEQFDFAFELARSGSAERLTGVHYKYALALEDDGKFQEAEKHFVAGKKPKEAVLMWVPFIGILLQCKEFVNAHQCI